MLHGAWTKEEAKKKSRRIMNNAMDFFLEKKEMLFCQIHV